MKPCDHIWRVFGNYAHEEVYPIFNDRGWLKCTKCGKDECVNEYKRIEKVPPIFPKLVVFGWPTYDTIVEIIKP